MNELSHLPLQMESLALHNALMLLGEESSSNGRQRVKKEGKKSKAGAAAKLGNKSKKAAGQKRPAVKVRDHPPSNGIQPVLCVLVCACTCCCFEQSVLRGFRCVST